MKNKYIPKVISGLLVGLLISGISAPPSFAKQPSEPTVNYAPPQGTIVNGVEEKSGNVNAQLVDYNNPVFVSYSSNNNSTIQYFKYIAGTSWDNTRSSSSFPLTLTIQRSNSSGSEFSGSVTFNGSVKAGIIGQLNVEVQGGAKETRATNEAVGWTFGPLVIPPYKTGGIDSYWEGTYSYGTLGVKYPDTYSPTGYTPTQYSQVNVSVHKNEYQKINGSSWIR